MKRVAGIAVAFALTLVTAVGLTFATLGAEAERTGRNFYLYRDRLHALSRPFAHVGPLVVWLGDSTMMGTSYPTILGPPLRAAGVTTVALADMAFDFYAYYFLMGRVIDMHPDLVVLPAHLSLFDERWRRMTHNDLASMVPAAELPRVLVLPWQARGLSPARVLLARLLRTGLVERVLYRAEGLRAMFGLLPARDALGPAIPARSVRARQREFFAFTRANLEHYTTPLGRRNPVLRMMAATVRLASEHGVRVLVVGIPIPYEALERIAAWDAPRYAARFALLRTVVEGNGGVFLDLHTALPRSEFRDTGGHYTAEGAWRLAALLEPAIKQRLATPRASRE